MRRRPASAPWRVVAWDARTFGPWTAELEDADVVINLAGRTVNCRYTPENRREILESRVASARVVGDAIGRCTRPPTVSLQASTATIYSHRFDAPNNEATGEIGGNEGDAPASWRFSIDVAKAWEAAAAESTPSGTRLVLLRSAMIMSPDSGGIFATLLRLWHIAPTRAVAVTSVVSLIDLPIHWLVFGFERMIGLGAVENLLQAVVQGVFAGAGATYLFTRSVVLLGAGRAAVFPSLVPGFTLLVGLLALGEVPTLAQLAGFAVVLIGFHMTQKS